MEGISSLNHAYLCMKSNKILDNCQVIRGKTTALIDRGAVLPGTFVLANFSAMADLSGLRHAY